MGRRWWTLVAGATAAVAVPSAWSPAGAGGIERIGGADRFDTAVLVSQRLYPDGAAVVVVASGTSSADALVAGPLAVMLHAPVLLSGPDGLPASTLGELTRLGATRVVVVGGTAAVPPVVEEQIRAVLGTGTERLSGADRYGTAAVVSSWFPAPSSQVVVAAGTVPTDALVGASTAAARGVPLLLTDSVSLPLSTSAALARLQPTDTVVVGGPGSVALSVTSSIETIGTRVNRLHGEDAAATAVAVAAARPAVPSQVLLVTGAAFPDGLAAVPLAQVLGAPVLLVESGCAPWEVVTYLRDLGWPDVTVVGGTSAVSPAAAAAAPCQPPPVGPVAPGVVVERHLLPGPVVAHVVRVDRRVGPVLQALTPSGGLHGRTPVSLLARARSAAVMVNGDFFTPSGVPVHMSAAGGRLLKSPGLIESVVAWDRSGLAVPVLGTPAPVVTAFSGSSAIPVMRVNDGAPAPGEVVALTTDGLDELSLPEPVCAAELRAPSSPSVGAGATYQVFTAGPTRCGGTSVTVAHDLLVVREADRALLAAVVEGQPVTVGWQPGPGWGPVSDVLGANLPLVRSGAVAPEIEVGTSSFFRTRAPRTAIGWTAAGEIVLVVVDGRQPGYSVGMTPIELARFMVGLGIDAGANLDGGGSSALAVRGVLVNKPSDVGGERAVGSALAVYAG